MPFPQLRGIVPPMVTPLRTPDSLDIPGLERLIEHLLAGGVHGLFILGTSGEAPSLPSALRRELIQRTCQVVAGRLPVLVGISDSSLAESLALAGHAAACGAAAVVAAPPYYFPATQQELLTYFRALAQALPLPLFLYNMPAMTKLVLEPETVRALCAEPNLVGLKDSSGDLHYFTRVLREIRAARPAWSVLVGPEHLLAEAVALGGDGGVNGGANLFPRLFVELFAAASAADAETVARLHGTVLQLGELYRLQPEFSAIIRGLKCALSLSGLCSDVMAPPFSAFAPLERARVQALLSALPL